IRTDVAQGTGFIITDDGYLVTNYHVIDGARYADALTSDSNSKQLTLIGYNPEMDVALLKIPGSYNSIEFDDSDNVKIGEKVIAIGNPLGLSFSVTEGIVSAVHRKIQNSPGGYIQTDAALNSGNSGGPLINTNGRVIGINNFKVKGDNIGFALESNFLVEEINKSSILILPSTSNAESFGMVLIEAMACKKPVIGSNIGGIPYVIDNGVNGLLVPPKNSQALTDAITKILSNPKLAKQMGENGYKKVKDGFTWDELSNKMDKIIQEVLRK
ncbi:trypsin-like peptidase domain-containing protein, partial [Candidatus Pacearchaeota archaeon]|nr:trypsin-like peptidase domain-containing protein [Candidatus Pacearchaeota archaeon]